MFGRNKTRFKIPEKILTESEPINPSNIPAPNDAINTNKVHYQYSERLARPFAVAYLSNTLEIDSTNVIVNYF